MSKFHSNWRKFLTEGTFKEQRMLREVSEDEVEHIRKALDELGPEELAFQDIFGEKTRVLIPFPTKDKESALGKFVAFFDNAGYQVNWGMGIMFGTKEFNDTSPGAIAAMLGALSRGGPDERAIKPKKIQMKIGKFFSKIDNLAKKIRKYQETMLNATEAGFDSDNEPVLSKRLEWQASWEGEYNSGEMWRNLTGREIKSALGDQETNYYRAVDQLRGFLNSDGRLMTQALKTEQPLGPVMAQYWQANADFIKKNVGTLEGDTYSILITRHPMDVLRMSDFDDITSCHSPGSRGGEASYYKCAVAEAHGHGGLAYVVRTSDLEEEFGTRNINAINESSAFQQNDDLFYDELRDTGGEIEPEARLRLRQVRYFENGVNNAKRHDEGVQLAVPEQATYGKNIPGFEAAVDKWLSGVQGAQVKYIAGGWTDGEPKINFKNFVKYGGSYEDTGIGELLKAMFDKEHAGREVKYSGSVYAVEQDYETEKQLERELDFGGTRALRQAGDEAVEDFKQTVGSSRIQEIDIDIEQEDGGVYAIPSVVIKFIFEDTNLTPEKYQSLKDIVRYIPQDMEDYGQNYDIFVKGRSFSNRAYTEARGGMADGENLVITLGIDFMKVNAGMLSFSGPDEMVDTMADTADTVNTHYEGYKILIQRFLMREGMVEGGVLEELGREVDNGEYNLLDWNVEVEYGDNEPHEYELVTANLPCEIDFSNTTKEIAQKIVADRVFWIRIREIMSDKARQRVEDDEGYQVDYDRFVDEIDPVSKRIEFRLNFHVGEDDRDSQVELFKAILDEWGGVEAVEELIQTEFNKFARAYNPENPQTISESHLRLRNRSREERMFDKWRRFLK